MLLEPDYRIHLRAGTHDGAEDSHAHGPPPLVIHASALLQSTS